MWKAERVNLLIEIADFSNSPKMGTFQAKREEMQVILPRNWMKLTIRTFSCEFGWNLSISRKTPFRSSKQTQTQIECRKENLFVSRSQPKIEQIESEWIWSSHRRAIKCHQLDYVEWVRVCVCKCMIVVVSRRNCRTTNLFTGLKGNRDNDELATPTKLSGILCVLLKNSFLW